MEKKRGARWFKLILILAIIVIVVYIIYPTALETVSVFVLMLYCTYRCVKALIIDTKLKKICCIEWWTYTGFLYLALMQNEMDIKSLVSTVITFTAVILFVIRMLITYSKAKDWKEAICFAVFFAFFLFAFSVISVRIEELFGLFRMLTLFVIVSIIKNTEYTNRFVGVIIVCFSYVLSIVIYGVLNSNFLLSSITEVEINFYFAVKNLYSLPDVGFFSSNKEMLGCIIDFVLCRIMDAVVISRLVDIFNEKDLGWFEKRKVKRCNTVQ